MLQATEQTPDQEKSQDQSQEQTQNHSQDQAQVQSSDQSQYQTQGSSEDQQVIQSLQYESRYLKQQLITVKIEGAKGVATMLVIFLAVVSIVRFFVRKRRLALLK